MLEAMSDLSGDHSSQDDQPSDQSTEDIKCSEPPETTITSSTEKTEPITPGNKTESDEPSDQSSEEVHSSETTEETETTSPEEKGTPPPDTTVTTTPQLLHKHLILW
jgi:hypothetical protein